MNLPRINLVVVGHKDHGKSTLIGRLLYDSDAIPEMKLQEIREELKEAGKEFQFAYILDSLEEERTGGLTIDIMQTPFKSERYYYTIIDCPGHKEFIQKMLTGASQADAAILVVSVKEGIEDQTRQHLFLVRTLGIRHLVVAANKMDEVGYREDEFMRFSEEMRRVLSSLGYRDAPIVPVSAFRGDNVVKRSENMPWYRGEPLIRVLDETVVPSKPLSEKPLRCVVQDIYDLEGRSVAVCRVETGTLKVGNRVVVLPSGEERTVRSIEAFGSEAGQAVPGDSVGVVLDGPARLRRGSVLAYPSEGLEPTRGFTAELIVFGNISLRKGATVPVRVGTATVNCRIQEINEKIDPAALIVISENPDSLVSGEVGKVSFVPEEPIYVERYSEFPQLGRFVIIGEEGAAAAGIILEKE
jgi:elongation factor 1-alpha